MRTVRLALVLLALAVFIGATMAAASAATATPTAMSSPVKKMPTAPTMMAPLKSPTKVPTPTKMAMGNMPGKINSKFGEANTAAGNAVKLAAAMMTKNTMQGIAQNSGKLSTKVTIPGMGGIAPQMDHLRQMPSLSMNMPVLASLGSLPAGLTI